MSRPRFRAGWLPLLTVVVTLAGLASCGTNTSAPPTLSPSGNCTGPATPRVEPDDGREGARAEAKDHPRITGATEIRWDKTTGRFRLTLHNGSCASWRDADLRFSFTDVGYEPETTRLAYRAGSAWKPVGLRWSDPDEPELLASSAVPVDFAPGQTRTYDFRITLPKPPNTRSFGVGARLAAGDRANEWSSTYSVRSYTGVRVKVTSPPSITPSGGWREFQVEVWAEVTLPRDVRLDLSTSAVGSWLVHETTRFEEYRSGGWHPLDRELPATEDFPLPAGKHERFRFRFRVDEIGAQENGMFGAAAQVRLAGERQGVVPLAGDGNPVKLILPTVRVVQPERRPKQAGETAEFRVTVDNSTKVDHPTQRLNFLILPWPYIGRIDYRAENEQAWTQLQGTRGTYGDIQLPELADGFHRTYVIRITTAKPTDQGLNWYVQLRHDANSPPLQYISGHL